jgi:ferric iron reductase protein FhuF
VIPALHVHVALVDKLGYNAGVYLAADYTPEFDSFKERLLELAQIRSVAELLRCVVTRLAEPPYVALARIWLVDKGDLCSSCCMRPECPDQTSCRECSAPCVLFQHNGHDPDACGRLRTVTDGPDRCFLK